MPQNLPQQEEQKREDKNRADASTDSPTLADRVDDSIHSRDEPLGKQAPGAPFALVGLAYMSLLALIVIAIAIYFFFFA